MKRLCLALLVVAGFGQGGCATDPYRSTTVNRTLTGTALGAALGAVAGSASGAGAFDGAVAGAIAGGAVGALVKGPEIRGRQYYRDTRGYCYYVGDDGRTVYDYNVKC